MKVLIVCSGTHSTVSPFVKEQMDSLAKLGIEISLFQIKKKGLIGYLVHLNSLKQFIKKFKPDIIHAHYGLSGLLANFQRRVPVVTTFHGCDIKNSKVFKFSKWTHKLSNASIFVESSMLNNVSRKDLSFVIPCGVDLLTFHPSTKEGLEDNSIIKKDCINILFASSFNNPVKNYALAKNSCDCLEEKFNKKINLIELKGFDRQQVNLLMNSADCVLLTSFSEGSPQFIKEAMACDCPIVSTNVGDVKWVIGNTEGCFLTSFDHKDVAEKIKLGIEFNLATGRTKGRERIIELGLDSENIAKKIIEVYKNVLHSNNKLCAESVE
jgi:teichuronic acid biosynthesis glycosyltransferase TuaC